jgi:hypothetical protein
LVRSSLADPVPQPLPTDRTQKLKDARSEAAKEIEAYKAKKDEEFKAFEKEVSPPLLVPVTAASSRVQPNEGEH